MGRHKSLEKKTVCLLETGLLKIYQNYSFPSFKNGYNYVKRALSDLR